MSSSTSHIYAYDETSTKFVRINAKGNDLTTHDAEALAKLEEIATNTSTASPSEAISAQTNINDVNTKIKLLSNASGHLAVDIKNTSVPVTGSFYPVTQPVSGSVSVSNQISGFATEGKLQEVNAKISTGSADVVSGSEIQQVLAYGLDTSTSIKHALDVDANGHLKTTQQDREIQRANSLIVNDSAGTALSGSLADGVSTAYVDIVNYDKLSMIVSGSNGGFGSLRIQASNTTADADFVDIDEVYEISAGTDFLFRYTTESAFFQYYRLRNTSGSTITFGKILVNNVK